MTCVQYFPGNIYPICHALSIYTDIPWFQDLTFHAISGHTDVMTSSSDFSLCVLQFVLHASHPLELHSCHFLAQNLSVAPYLPWWLIYNLLSGSVSSSLVPGHSVLSPISSQRFMKMLYSLLCFCPHSSCPPPLAQQPLCINLSHSIQRLTQVSSSTWNLLSSPPILTDFLLQEHPKLTFFWSQICSPS